MTNIKGNANIIIQEVSDSTITVNVNGEIQRLEKKLDTMLEFMKSQQSQTFQTADKIYNIGSIGQANFDFVVDQLKHGKKLPEEIANSYYENDAVWIKSLKQQLIRHGVSVSDRASVVFQYYGWLIETFLQKMNTPVGKERNLRRLAFMAEVFQSSSRYLCYIQLAQVLINKEQAAAPMIKAFFDKSESELQQFDWLNFLISTDDLLSNKDNFVSELPDFVEELGDTESDLYEVALFLEKNRRKLLQNAIAEDEHLNQLLDEYLAALVYWLGYIAFLAKYRLVSIKDINLNYRLGSAKNFIHLYGELHGMYNENHGEEGDFVSHSIQDFFTYNKSVLLFKGRDINTCLNNIGNNSNYLSLSPLIIDQSVFAEKETQTPEIYYYIGKAKRRYLFAQYKNELAFGDAADLSSNKSIKVKVTNINQPKLDELFEQMEQILKPFKTAQA